MLPTLYDTRTKLAREVLSELRAKFRDYLMESTVNFNTKLKEAASFGQPITEYDPGSRGYKDFVNLARELMGHRPVDLEPTPTETLSRPAELVQRAKQLAQLANFQFGRTNMQQPAATPAPTPVPAAPESKPFTRPEPVRTAATISRVSEMGLDLIEPAPESGSFLSSGGAIAVATAPAPIATVTKTKLDLSIAPLTIAPVAITPVIEAKPQPTTEEKIEAFYGVKQVGDQVMFPPGLKRRRRC